MPALKRYITTSGDCVSRDISPCRLTAPTGGGCAIVLNIDATEILLNPPTAGCIKLYDAIDPAHLIMLRVQKHLHVLRLC